jgi:hypothetical protein
LAPSSTKSRNPQWRTDTRAWIVTSRACSELSVSQSRGPVAAKPAWVSSFCWWICSWLRRLTMLISSGANCITVALSGGEVYPKKSRCALTRKERLRTIPP